MDIANAGRSNRSARGILLRQAQRARIGRLLSRWGEGSVSMQWWITVLATFR